MKYFFLADGWTVGRVWEAGGLWNETVWRRQPQIENLHLCIVEHGETLWLYQVEETVLMVEVKPNHPEQLEGSAQVIGQVVLKRLITGDQVIHHLCHAETVFRPTA